MQIHSRIPGNIRSRQKRLAIVLMLFFIISADVFFSSALASTTDANVVKTNLSTKSSPTHGFGRQSVNKYQLVAKASKRRRSSNLPGYRPPYEKDGTRQYRPTERRGYNDRYENYFRNANPDPWMCIRWREECRIGFWRSCENLRGACSIIAYCDALRFQCNVKSGAACFKLKEAC